MATYLFPDGFTVMTTHLPGRKKPALVNSDHGEYTGHAVFTNDESMEAFDAIMDRLVGKEE